MIVTKMNASNEKPVGEWNSAEVICDDSTVTVYINGELQNRITGVSNNKGAISACRAKAAPSNSAVWNSPARIGGKPLPDCKNCRDEKFPRVVRPGELSLSGRGIGS